MNKFIQTHLVTFVQLAFPSVMDTFKSGPSCLLYKKKCMYYLNSRMNYILPPGKTVKFSHETGLTTPQKRAMS